MEQIRANTPAPIKANLMAELLSVQMSWGNGGCRRAGSPGDQQTRELGPWDARRSRTTMRANAWGHDELTHLPLDKMAAISQMIFSDAFSWMENFVFWKKSTEVCF